MSQIPVNLSSIEKVRRLSFLMSKRNDLHADLLKIQVTIQDVLNMPGLQDDETLAVSLINMINRRNTLVEALANALAEHADLHTSLFK